MGKMRKCDVLFYKLFISLAFSVAGDRIAGGVEGLFAYIYYVLYQVWLLFLCA